MGDAKLEDDATILMAPSNKLAFKILKYLSNGLGVSFRFRSHSDHKFVGPLWREIHLVFVGDSALVSPSIP